MTMKEFKKILKQENNPIIKETLWMLLTTIVYIIGLASLLYMQLNNIIPSVVSLIFIGVLILIATPAMVIDLKRDKKIKKMYLYYKQENEILKIKDEVKTLKMVFISLIVSVMLMMSFIVPKYIINSEKEKVQNKEKIEKFDIKTKDGNVVETEYYTFDNDSFYLKIPKDFDSMSEELLSVKYQSGNVPTYVLTNKETTINVVANVTIDKISNENIKAFTNQMKETLKQTDTIIETNVYEKEGRNIGEIKFISKAEDTDIYNHMIVFSVNDTLRVVSFNCTKELQENWQNVGDFIIDSLSFKIK